MSASSSSSSTTATATDEPDPEIFIAQANALPDLQWLAVAELLPYEELLTFGFGSAAFAYRFLGKPRTDAVPLDVVATSSMLSLLLRRDYGIAGTHAACEPMPYELRQLAIVAYHRHIGRDEGVFSRALITRAPEIGTRFCAPPRSLSLAADCSSRCRVSSFSAARAL